ncbi:MAG TPA: hypothetical protein VHO70_08595 [Chitinispirillaceae bacterium]|nr:hypothetical protein [Chitinispirillaceae bacterium]
MLNAGNIKEWKSRNLINCLFGMGNGKEFDQWINYLSESEKQNIPLIGPIFWEGKGPLHYVRNSNINSIQKYIEQAKGSKNLIGWSWQDEPNMGGECQYVPAPVCRSWTYICHNYDPDRLVFINLMGADFFPGNHLDWSWHHSRINKFNYWGDQKKFFGNKDQFGGKPAMIADVIGFDNYPIEYSEAAGFNDPSRGPIDISLESFDNAKEWNKDLLPIMVFIETNDLHGDGNPAPLPSQVYMMAWLNIIHGAKGINWFHYFNPTSLETEKMMALFNKQMDLYQHIILGAKPDVDISDNADVRGRRVDIMVRQKDSLVYIFAGRVTEPSWEYKEVDEPSSIDVTFKTGSLSSRPVKTLFPAESNTLVQNQSGFTDIFSRDQIKIYCISKDKLTESVKPALKGNSSNSLYRILSKKQGNIFENNSDEKLKISIFNTRGQFVKNVTIEPMAGKLLDKELPIGKYIIYSERFKGSFSMVVLKCEH